MLLAPGQLTFYCSITHERMIKRDRPEIERVVVLARWPRVASGAEKLSENLCFQITLVESPVCFSLGCRKTGTAFCCSKIKMLLINRAYGQFYDSQLDDQSNDWRQCIEFDPRQLQQFKSQTLISQQDVRCRHSYHRSIFDRNLFAKFITIIIMIKIVIVLIRSLLF